MVELEKRTLYVGVDDSNHGNHLEERRADIIAAVFSFDQEDALFRGFPARRDCGQMYEWFEDLTRDFRFVTLQNDKLRRIQPTIPLVVPDLVGNFLNTLPVTADSIKIYIDGILPRAHKTYLRDYFGKIFNQVLVENVTKRDCERARRPKASKYFGPNLLRIADTKANQIYHEYFNFVSEHPKHVSVDEPALLDLHVRLTAA